MASFNKSQHVKSYFRNDLNPIENENFTNETLAYMTPYTKAQKLASIIEGFGGKYVIDANAGIGGNTTAFASNSSIRNVISYEVVENRWKMLHNNISLYNIQNKVRAYNQEFELGEDLKLLNLEDNESKTVVYFDPPWISPNSSIDKTNYIQSGIQVSGKSLEYWCKFLLSKGYLAVIIHVPKDYELILDGKFVDDKTSNKARLIYCTLNSDVENYIVNTLQIFRTGEMKTDNLPQEEQTIHKPIERIPPPALVKGPKVILQTYLTPDFPRKRYVKEHFNPKAIHLGQRKLLISEIEFLTRVIRKAKEKEQGKIEYSLLYVGAAPGQHIPILSDMFPEIKFILYDPAKFAIQPSKSIEIHQTLFTDEEAEKYKGRKDLLFVSDIRSVPRSGYQDPDNVDSEFEEEVLKNLNQQRKWVEDLHPIRSLLKFRLPFTPESDNVTTEYFDGVINFQAYSPSQSAETRLEVGNNPKIITYNNTIYEQQMFYFNTNYRIQGFQHYNRRYGWSYDTIREFMILKKYISLRGEGELNIPKYFEKFDSLTDKQEKKISRILEKY